MSQMAKDWDRHVVDAEELARTVGFQRLRDEILRVARPGGEDVAVDVGAGTGLLTLALAPAVEKVWAIDVSSAMIDYLATKAASGELDNVETATATAVSLPLVDGAASLVVSNYCYHHLSDGEKERGIAEIFRVLQPGGRVVIGDMMFRVQVADQRSRQVLMSKVRSVLRRGPAGFLRLLKNMLRLLTGRWEQPADGEWWRRSLRRAGFCDIELRLLEHEGGIVSARRPLRASDGRRWPRARRPRGSDRAAAHAR
jgi:ubiquinone/menaquinone biosynthesis C-methylase UbiE